MRCSVASSVSFSVALLDLLCCLDPAGDGAESLGKLDPSSSLESFADSLSTPFTDLPLLSDVEPLADACFLEAVADSMFPTIGVDSSSSDSGTSYTLRVVRLASDRRVFFVGVSWVVALSADTGRS
jgi:hypothetical protein